MQTSPQFLKNVGNILKFQRNSKILSFTKLHQNVGRCQIHTIVLRSPKRKTLLTSINLSPSPAITSSLRFNSSSSSRGDNLDSPVVSSVTDIDTASSSIQDIQNNQSSNVSTSTSDFDPSLVSNAADQSTSVASLGKLEIIENHPIENYIPDIPEPPLVVEEIQNVILNAAGEPSIQSLGLGGWTPSGMVQHCLEFIHATCGLPWWGTIVTGTIIVRLCLFPLVIKAQRNATKMNNHLPQMQVIQVKMTEARQSGNALMAAKYSNELMLFMKEKDINPLKNMIVPLTMAPIFISVFFGLRGMANLPVESFREGGIFWFTDLTVADPYYLLPLITCCTLAATLELGADGIKLNNQSGFIIKYVLRFMPVVLFPFMINFPSALLCYWASTNAVSLTQVLVLKIPAVREKLKLGQIKKHNPENMPIQNKGFVQGFKENWQNAKITKELENRERFDEMNYKRAGRGPIPKTYKYDPTKVQAKSK